MGDYLFDEDQSDSAFGPEESVRTCTDNERTIAIDQDWDEWDEPRLSVRRLLGGGDAIALFLSLTLAGEEIAKGCVADRDELTA